MYELIDARDAGFGKVYVLLFDLQGRLKVRPACRSAKRRRWMDPYKYPGRTGTTDLDVLWKLPSVSNLIILV